MWPQPSFFFFFLSVKGHSQCNVTEIQMLAERCSSVIRNFIQFVSMQLLFLCYRLDNTVNANEHYD